MSLDIDTGKRLVLLLNLIVVHALLAAAIWPTCWFVVAVQPFVHSPSGWTLLILGAVLIFNYAYLLALLGLRVLIPYPKEGYYRRTKDGQLPREAVVFMLNVLLNKCRAHTPWATMFSSVLVSLFPLNGLYRRYFGPKTTSVTMGDTAIFLDPYLVTAGKNVQFGFGCMLACHFFDSRGLLIKGIEIGDHVTIGGQALIAPGVKIGDHVTICGQCAISPGVKIGNHSVIAARAMVASNTVIGPYEYWEGVPAQKVKDLRQPVDNTIPAEPAEPVSEFGIEPSCRLREAGVLTSCEAAHGEHEQNNAAWESQN